MLKLGAPSFPVPVANLELLTSLMRLIYLPGANNEVPTPLDGVCEKHSVALRVDGLTSTDGIVQIEKPGFPCNCTLHAKFPRNHRTTCYVAAR